MMPSIETQTNNPNALSQNYEPLPADGALEQLIHKNLLLYGHGTPQEEGATAILHEGLGMSVPDLGSTATGMSTAEDRPDAFETNKKLIESWPHRDHKFVVMIGVERFPDEDIPHRQYMNAIVQEKPGAKKEFFSQDYFVDPKFIAGYFNTERDEFVPNPNFDPSFNPDLLKTTPDMHFAMRQRTMDDLMGGVAVGSAIDKPVSLHDHDDSDDIW